MKLFMRQFSIVFSLSNKLEILLLVESFYLMGSHFFSKFGIELMIIATNFSVIVSQS